MTQDADIGINKQRARRAFDRAVGTYDAHAALQRLVVDQLVERLDLIRINPATILDIGAGTGYCARALQFVFRERVRSYSICQHRC